MVILRKFRGKYCAKAITYLVVIICKEVTHFFVLMASFILILCVDGLYGIIFIVL